MIGLPFIYFSLLTLFLFSKKRKIDFAIILSGFFAVSGLFSIVLDTFNLGSRVTSNYSISLFAGTFYCFLLTLGIIPFAINSNISIKKISSVRYPSLLKIIAWVAFIRFVALVVLSFDEFLIIITGDFGEMRAELYREEFDLNYMVSLPALVRLIMAIFNMIFGAPWILILLGFYSRFVQKLPSIYFLLFILASLSGIWSGILGVDRSAATYWIISFIMIYFFFRQFMDEKAQKKVVTILFILVGIAALYIGAVTISRFGENDYGAGLSGTQGGIISYLGQNYINFCYFFDNFHCNWKTLNIIFPFTGKYLLNSQFVGGVPIQQHLTLLTGIETGVFYTYLGQIMISAGKEVMIIYSLFHCLGSIFLLRKIRCKSVSLITVFLYILLSSIVYLGAWVYYYSSPSITFSVIFFLILFKILGKRYV